MSNRYSAQGMLPGKIARTKVADLKLTYESVTADKALQSLEGFAVRRDTKYPEINR